MRYFYCLLFAMSMFVGCSKDEGVPKKDNLLETQIFFTNSGTVPGSDLYYNQVYFHYPRSINATITVSVQFNLKDRDTTVTGTIEPNYTSKPSAYGDGQTIIGITKEFKLTTHSKAIEAKLAKVSCDDPKYSFKILRSLNEVHASQGD